MKKRILYFDYLRIFAFFGIVVLHVAATFWYKAEGVNQIIYTVCDSFGRFGVASFTMISGALFLSRDISIVKIWKKHIPKVMIAFVLSSLLYAYLYNRETFINKFLSGHTHLWFLPMIAMLYALTPILRQISRNEKLLIYFIIICFIHTIVTPTILTLGMDFGSKTLNSYFNSAHNTYKNLHINLGYVLYFMLGHYINIHDIKKKYISMIGGLGLLGYMLTVILTVMITTKSGEPNQHYYDNLSLNVFLYAVAVFILFKYIPFKENKFIYKLSNLTFIGYLIHMIVLKELINSGFNQESYSAWILVISLSLLTFFISLIASYVLVCVLEVVKKCFSKVLIMTNHDVMVTKFQGEKIKMSDLDNYTGEKLKNSNYI